METEYIEKQAAIDAVDSVPAADWVRKRYMGELERIPPSDVRPVVRGHWERVEGDSRFMCSVCKSKEHVPTIMGQPTVWDYCPNCGAWMKGGESDG